MELKLFAIKDTKVEFEPPFCLQTTQELLRAAKALVNEERPNKFNQYPEDKELWQIGIFDTKTGKLICNSQEHICNLGDLKSNITTKQAVKEATAEKAEDHGTEENK